MTQKIEIPGQFTADQGLRIFNTKPEHNTRIIQKKPNVKTNINRQELTEKVLFDSETEQFLALFGRKEHLFRVFPDKDEDKTEERRHNLTKKFPKQSFSSAKAELMTYNRKGSGIFFVVNESNGHLKKDVTEIASVFLDLDGSPLDNIERATIKPHCVLQTSEGRWHVYWLVSGLPVSQFRAYQQEIARVYGGDTAISDTSRVMRLPGFYHMKHADPYLSRIVEINADLPKYSPGEIIHGLGLDEYQIHKETITISNDDKKPFILPDVILKGHRDETLFRYICHLWELGYSEQELLEKATEANNERCNPMLAQHIITEKVDRVTKRYPKGEHKVRNLSLAKDKFNPNTWADSLLSKKRLIFDDEDFMGYNGRFFEKVDDNDIKYDIRDSSNWIANSRHTNEIMEAMRIKAFRGKPKRDPKGFFCLRNGIFNYQEGNAFPHSSDFFLTHMIDINYDAIARCPLWLQTLMDILPDPASRLLLQKYAGYTLTTDVHHQVCLYMFGGGGNGKSTILDVIQALIGEKNRKALSLKDMSKHFMLQELKGLLANFSSEVDSAFIQNDDIFKKLVDGSLLTADIKYKKPVSFNPFCKLWIASNALISSKDTSEGFLRRFMFLDFPVSFENNPKKDKKRAHKIINSEMSGVLNWAIEGLKLLNQDGFDPLPDCHARLRADVKSKIHPRSDFFSLYLMPKHGDAVALQDVVQAYNNYAKDMRRNPVSDATIKADILEHFKGSELKRRAQGMFLTNICFVQPEDIYDLEGVTDDIPF